MTRARPPIDRRRAGAAMVLVIVVLGALALVAAPFALSMRNLEAGSLQRLRDGQARAGTGLVLAAARRHLEDTHPLLDAATPHHDDREEIEPPDLAARHDDVLTRDPRGAIRSVSVDDLSGRAHLGTASPFLLGNLLGGRTALAEDATDDDDRLAVVDTQGWSPSGYAWVGHELIEYGALGPGRLQECDRGVPSANLVGSRAAAHRAGDAVLDLRLLLLAQHGWRIRPGVYDAFRRVDGLKDIGLFGELAYTADAVDAARPFLTVQPGTVRWVDPQAPLWTGTGMHGHSEVWLPDGGRYGPGTVVQVTAPDGGHEWNLVASVTDWDDHWRVTLLEPLTGRHGDGTVVRRLHRRPVNVNTAPRTVLVALLEGLGRSPVADVVTVPESIALADALTALGDGAADAADLEIALRAPLEAGAFSAVDLAAAGLLLKREGLRVGSLGADQLAARIIGAESRRSVRRISRRKAEALAERIAAGSPASHDDLAALLTAAEASGEIGAADKEVVLRCAVDAGDARITGGTAPFAYGSAGWFELHAAASENHANGREQARAFARQVVTVAPPGESGRVFATQRDFEEALLRGDGERGWTTGPHRLRSGTLPRTPSLVEMSARMATLDERDEEGVIDLVAAFDALLGLPDGRADRAGGLLARGPSASTAAAGSDLRPATARASLPDVLHFDEGLPALTGEVPDGLRVGETHGLSLATDKILPAITGSDGRLHPFTVEFWMELDDVTAETILFDGGVDELEDRVLLYLDDGELVLRVCDTAIPDFEASMPSGRVPPTGEIRYAFDDGLSLLAGVPYHVAAWIGGARDTQMALFVDGVPRGRRSFTTRLAADVDGADAGVGAGVASYLGETELPVESTAGFPRQGVLRVGQEIIEYIDKTEDAFIVAASGPSDPFGGRARRGTGGPDHETSEVVELMGYVHMLMSAEASRGAGTLAGALSRFGIAELDPTRLTSDTIFIVPVAIGAPADPVELGTGLLAGSTTIPVRAAGSAPFDTNTFQAGGGHALLVCDYGGNTVSNGQISTPGSTVTTSIGARTQGGWLGGVEVIRYTGFSGGTLTGVQRNASGIPQSMGGPASPLLTGAAADTVAGGSGDFTAPREWVTEFDAAILGQVQGLPDQPRVLVIPISVGVTGGDLFRDYHPHGAVGTTSVSALTQLGLDFDVGVDATEWVRWDTATASHLVRDDLVAVNDMVESIKSAGVWDRRSSTVDLDFAEGLNDDLEFRAQADTGHVDHTGGSQVLPTIAVGNWFADATVAENGVPGRHDAVTLVGSDGLKEWHRINWSTTQEAEYRTQALVAFRFPVIEPFAFSDYNLDENFATEDLSIAEAFADGDSDYITDIENLNIDSRRLTRLIKRPSGELPAAPLSHVSFGRDYDGRLSDGPFVIDELRFAVTDKPGPLLQKTYRFRLAEDLEHEEDDELRLNVSSVVMPHGTLRHLLLGADVLEVLSTLDPAGGLLLLGEEIVGYAGVDPTDTGAVYLTGRGLYGTPRSVHERGTPVVALDFWPVTPLAARVGADDPALPLADEWAFPDGHGLAWVDDELVGFTGVEEGALVMPADGRVGRLLQPGLLRGRFGTTPQPHEAGAMVRWMPARHRDRALLGTGRPEGEFASAPVEADGAFFTDVVVQARLPVDTLALDVRLVLDGRADRHDAPEPGTALLGATAEGRADERLTIRLGRQADRLDLFFSARWLPGAFDPEGFASHGWKLAPAVESVTVGHVQPTVVLEHEEWP